ncbi:MAG: hypothetical protein ABIX46_00710 [Burkholderiaceae bacterium]
MHLGVALCHAGQPLRAGRRVDVEQRVGDLVGGPRKEMALRRTLRNPAVMAFRQAR